MVSKKYKQIINRLFYISEYFFIYFIPYFALKVVCISFQLFHIFTALFALTYVKVQYKKVYQIHF